MWNGTWDDAGMVYTGIYTAATGEIWTGTVTINGTVAGSYIWSGSWSLMRSAGEFLTIPTLTRR